MTVSDEELVRSVLQGDIAAFGSLLQRHQQAVIALCRRQVGDHHQAEDLAQEAFLRTYVDLHALREPARFGPWVRAIALRLCQSWHRRRRETPMQDDQLLPMLAGQPTPDADDLFVRGMLELLPDRYRDVVTLRYMEGRTQNEVASLLGIPTETVRTRLRRARKRLKEAWQSMKDEEFAHRVLEKLEVVSTESGLVWPLYACLHALGSDWTLTYLMGVTGMAFRAAVDDHITDAGYTCALDWPQWTKTICGLGHEVTIFNAQLKSFSPDIPTNNEAEFRAAQSAAWESVRASVDRGVPAIAWMPMTLEQKAQGLKCEYGLLVGYDAEHGTYDVRLPWAPMYQVPWDGFGKADPVDWFNVIVFGKERPIDERALERGALEFAVEYAHSAQPGQGLSGYEMWLRALGRKSIQPDGGIRAARLLREARQGAAEFLTGLSASPEEIVEAVKHYRQEVAAWEKYIRVFSDAADPGKYQVAREAVEAALAAEKKAVEAIEQAL